MRRDRLYLIDIVAAVESIARFMTDKSRLTFLSDELVQSAVLQKLIVIGEAASRLSTEFKSNHQQVEWADIIAFRNIAVHAYFAVDWAIVWVAATRDTPILMSQIAQILAEENVDEDASDI
jgi:uncharacterized protein with HEPN domain